MANQLMPKFKEALLKADIDLENDDIRWVLIDTGAYTFSSAHDFLADVASGARLATSGALGSKTFTNGLFDAADPSLTDPGGGATAEAMYLYKHTGSDATALLIAWFDTGVTGLPLTLDGTNDSIQHNASGIFQL